MKKSKILLIVLIPIIVVLLAAGGLFAYLTIYSTPQKIFKTAIGSAMDEMKEKQKKYNAIKSNIDLTVDMETDNESMIETRDLLKALKLSIDTNIDYNKTFLFNNTKIKYNDENLLNLEAFLQDQKAYIGFRDWFDKYIMFSDESVSESGDETLTEALKKSKTIDSALILEAVKQELENEVSKQRIIKEEAFLDIDGNKVKVKKNTLELNEKERIVFIREFLENLENNTIFQNSLGDYKYETLTKIDDIINDYRKKEDNFVDIQNETGDEDIKQNSVTDSKISFSIYTSGLFNKMVAFDIVMIDDSENISGIEFINHNENTKEFNMYKGNSEEKEYLLKAIDKKDSTVVYNGTLRVSIFNNGQESAYICTYGKNNNEFKYNITEEGKETNTFNITGNVTQENEKYDGHVTIMFVESQNSKIAVKCNYKIELNEEIPNIDTSDSKNINDLTAEEQDELMTNFQNSKLYNMFLKGYGIIPMDMFQRAKTATNTNYIESADYTVNYKIPSLWTKLELDNSNHQFMRDNNRVNIGITENNQEDCITMINEKYSNDYSVSETMDYEVGGLIFKYMNATNGNGGYLFFMYPLDFGTTYMVIVETEDGNVSLEDIKYFLEIEVSQTREDFENIINEYSDISVEAL